MKRTLQPPKSNARSGQRANGVVMLSEARDARRITDTEKRIDLVLDANKRALMDLAQTGLLFTRRGSRLGRDLLLAHQHLIRIVDLIARMREVAKNAKEGSPEIDALYDEMQALLAKSSALTLRSDRLLSPRRTDHE